MNSKKIIRLKTPYRNKDELKGYNDYQQSGNIDEETIMKGCRIDNHENVSNALIEELNKAYQDNEQQPTLLFSFKNLFLESEQVKEALIDENELLKGRLEMLERECQLEKEKYRLERQNHQRLRQFYEKREKQWMSILSEQRRIIEYYNTRREDNLYAQYYKNTDKNRQTTARTQSNQYSSGSPFSSKEGFPKMGSARIPKPLRKSLSANKHRFSHGQNFFQKHRIMEEISKRCIPEKRKESSQKKLKSIRERSEFKSLCKQEQDDLLDTIMRRTYYRFRDVGKKLKDIGESEEMQKLKMANSTTKDRLCKTLKKLNFEVDDELLPKFISRIEEEIINFHGQLKGEYVFCFLMKKLNQCQLMALGSNSVINKFCEKDRSEEHDQIPKEKEEVVSKNKEPATIIEQLKSSNLELLLTSNVREQNKQDKLISLIQAEVSEVRRVSGDESSLCNLSDLINASRDYLQEITGV